MNAVKIILMTALLTAVSMSAFGQQGSASTQPDGQNNDGRGVQYSGQPGPSGPLSDQKREEVRKKIDAIRIWRLTEALKLDANTSAKLSSLLSSNDHQRRKIHREQTGTISILRSAFNSPKPDESQIKSCLDILEKNHQAMQELMNNERSGLKNILTIEQQARYVIFQRDFMREMRGMIGGAHGHPGKGGRGVGNEADR